MSKYKIGQKVFVKYPNVPAGPYPIVGIYNDTSYLIIYNQGFIINDTFIVRYKILNPTSDGIDLLKEKGFWIDQSSISGLYTKCSCKIYTESPK